ncbi:hypothetical protein JXA02_10455 [candidate division KSB1 bacterium]|nr:hypothetical protein [candidate division KSB1 bacterium]RQW03332.1 MAG: hypothetical protein EH222_12545 [candidate division KSB1 bacterium]
MIKKVSLIFFIAILLAIHCSNPLKNEEKKELVIHFIDDVFDLTGRYVFFWDGKDEHKKYVEPGKYIILLSIRDWQDQTFVSVEADGKPNANDSSRFEPGFWLNHELEAPYPDPFQVQAGVNIPVLIAEPARIRINIYKD